MVASGGTAWGGGTGGTISLSSPTYDAGLATYVNGVEILASQWEFTLLFSQISGSLQPSQSAAEPGAAPDVQVTKTLVGRFAMSPQHAKALVEILRQRVEGYEAQFGALPALSLLLPGSEVQGGEGSGPSPRSDLPAEPTSPEESSQGG
jgi:hypothetical protein